MNRKFLVAAGLLCLGTSPALAFTIPPMAPDMAKAVKDVWAVQLASEQTGMSESALMAKTDDAVSYGDALPANSADMTAGDPDLDLSAKPEDASAKAGPSEAMMETGSTPAAAAYPACRRGAADDHCIQLYERGVRAQLTEWNHSAGGSEAGVGGPYEPVDSTLAGELGGADTQAAMKDDDSSDDSMGEAEDEAAPPK